MYMYFFWVRLRHLCERGDCEHSFIQSAREKQQLQSITSAYFSFLLTLLYFFFYLCVQIVVPSVWFLVSLIGSTACVTFSYVFPGLLLFRRAQNGAGKALGGAVVGLAALIASTAIFNTLTGNGAA